MGSPLSGFHTLTGVTPDAIPATTYFVGIIMDVYAYGMIASSTWHLLTGAFPPAEGYGEIQATYEMTGGEATNSAIVLARLGASVKLDGNWLGDDAPGWRTRTLLEGYGIDVSRLQPQPAYHGVREVVMAAQQTRTVFGTYGQLLAETHWNLPHEEDIARAHVVCHDPFFRDASYRAAEIAAQLGVPVVTVLSPCRR